MKEVSLSDEQLVQLYTLGNQQAMSILFNRHYKKVLLYLYFKMRDKNTAQDLLQDSFIKVIKYINEGKYKNNGKFYHLLIRICRNSYIDYIRAQKIRPKIVEIDSLSQFSVPFNEIINIVIEKKQEQTINDIIALVDLLPSDEREIVILKHYGELSFKEIAILMDININTALGKMRNALMRLRVYANDRGLKYKL